MTAYRLSARAAEAEARANASREVAIERKSVSWIEGQSVGRSDGDNFITNRITVEANDDTRGTNMTSVLGLSATWACVGFWAGNIAALPVVIYRTGPGGVPVEAPDHPLYWLLHTSPNYDQSAFDFWEFMVASIELHGNAYAEMTMRTDGLLGALTPIRPDIMNVRRLSSGTLEYTWYDAGRKRTAPQDQILHIRGFGGGPLGGLSPLAVCRQAFAAALAPERASASMFRNGVRTTGVLSTEKALTGLQRTETEGLLQDKFVGAQNAGRPMLLDNGLTWTSLTINPADAEMLESRKFGIEDTCRIFDVDPHLVGHTAGNTMLGSSIKDQTQSLLKFKLRKRLKRIEGALEKQLLTARDRAQGVSISFNVEAFLRADSEGRADYYDKMKRFMTINQVRALEGWAPVPGGDVLWVQMQDVPLQQALAGATEKQNV